MMASSRRIALAGGITFCLAPTLRQGILDGTCRFEIRAHRGEQLVLAWWQHPDGEAVRAFSLLECAGDRIARMRTYFHTPEAIAEVCRESGVLFQHRLLLMSVILTRLSRNQESRGKAGSVTAESFFQFNDSVMNQSVHIASNSVRALTGRVVGAASALSQLTGGSPHARPASHP